MYTFDAWHGDNYERTRLFLVANSSYKSANEIFIPDYRKNQWKYYLCNSWDKKTKMEDGTVRILSGQRDTVRNRSRVVHCFAMENYVNDCLVDKDEGPTPSEYQRAAVRFPHLLMSLEYYPTHIVVLGAGTFYKIRDDTRLHIKPDGRFYSFMGPEGQTVRVAVVNHPSRFRYADHDEMRAFLPSEVLARITGL